MSSFVVCCCVVDGVLWRFMASFLCQTVGDGTYELPTSPLRFIVNVEGNSQKAILEN